MTSKRYLDFGSFINLLGEFFIVYEQHTTGASSPLFISMQNGNIDIVKVLIAAGGNLNQATTDDGSQLLKMKISILSDAKSKTKTSDGGGNAM